MVTHRHLALSVSHGGWYLKLSLATNLHPNKTLVPTLDNLTSTESELELEYPRQHYQSSARSANKWKETHRRAARILVDDLSVGELEDVSHFKVLALLGNFSRPDDLVLNNDTASCRERLATLRSIARSTSLCSVLILILSRLSSLRAHLGRFSFGLVLFLNLLLSSGGLSLFLLLCLLSLLLRCIDFGGRGGLAVGSL